MKLLIIIEAVAELAFHDLFVRIATFETLLLRIKSIPLPIKSQPDDPTDIVCECLSVACGLYPVRTLCLKRSYVLVRMLRRRGVPAMIVIGVQTLPFKAHAWVTVEGRVVDDMLATREHFTVLETC